MKNINMIDSVQILSRISSSSGKKASGLSEVVVRPILMSDPAEEFLRSLTRFLPCLHCLFDTLSDSDETGSEAGYSLDSLTLISRRHVLSHGLPLLLDEAADVGPGGRRTTRTEENPRIREADDQQELEGARSRAGSVSSEQPRASGGEARQDLDAELLERIENTSQDELRRWGSRCDSMPDPVQAGLLRRFLAPLALRLQARHDESLVAGGDRALGGTRIRAGDTPTISEASTSDVLVIDRTTAEGVDECRALDFAASLLHSASTNPRILCQRVRRRERLREDSLVLVLEEYRNKRVQVVPGIVDAGMIRRREKTVVRLCSDDWIAAPERYGNESIYFISIIE
ncbi:unnamed protein product [Amoebophrya sp. A25]|nr:unnamed protein product [Amoebophrya sp. A25]|eukprot:GSA25T00000450001.1